jgi:signal transduction histidine kinase
MAPVNMSAKNESARRGDTDTSLRLERQNTDNELARRVTVADADVDQVVKLAREQAERLLHAARAAADERLRLSEQTKAAVALLLGQRGREDRTLAAEREQADELLGRERAELREKLSELLALERQTTDLHLALERRSADKAVGSRDDFLAQVSHDLRGLVAAHKLYLAVLVKEAGGEYGRRLASHVATLLRIDEDMERMIGDLVDAVAIEAGKLRVTLQPHSATELLSMAITVFEPLAKERGQSLSVSPAPADVSVVVDVTRGIQVLGNLLSNAIKFTPRDGKIRVGFEPTGDEVVFSVADTGPGVSADQAEHIFERFEASSSSSSGLGLGLFIAAQLVNAHGGRLWLDRNTAPGAVFRFALRRAGSPLGANRGPVS